MTRDEFLARLHQPTLWQPASDYPLPIKTRPAAVLMPLIETTDGLDLILTERASHLKHHAGQISFPGGKQEDSDFDTLHTAIRETQEEIGLTFSSDDIVGSLPEFRTISGFVVTPYIALSDTLSVKDAEIDEGEVESVFSIPLAHFMLSDFHHAETFSRNGVTHSIHSYLHKSRFIWGATAAFIYNLTQALGR